MSNIRDLQKLKNTRFSQPLGSQTHRTPNPEQNHFNYEPISLQIPQNKPSRSTQYAKESLRATPSKVIHKRGASFGTPDNSERHTFNLMQNPRLSIYNFPLKMNLPSSIRDQETYEMPKTERKARNNYVTCKDPSSRKDTLVLNFNHGSDKEKEIGRAMFSRLMPVGKGGFGKVWKVQHKRNKLIYAMKLMSKAKVISKKSVASVLNERNFLARLSHPFIVNMIYGFQDRESLYLIMDYLDGGDLRYHLGNRQFFSQRETKFFIANIVLALEYLHKQKIIHRDLKPQNLVFDSQGYLKLTDLGISRQLREDNHHDTSGTPGYMAPEVMMRKSHSFAVDYFALGVIAYELMLGRRPYQGANRKEIKQQMLSRQAAVKMDQLPYKWSPNCLDFINKLILRNPEQRLGSTGIEQLKSHAWLSDIDWQKLKNRKVKTPFKPMTIEEDYENYKEQISQDTVNDNEEEIQMLLRRQETQELFEGYHFEGLQARSGPSTMRKASYPTNSTEENFSRR